MLYAACGASRSGRVPVLFLDTDSPTTRVSDRPITNAYVPSVARCVCTRNLSWERAGVRALKALGISPLIWHLNEGHSAFLLVERTRDLVARGVALEEAFRRVRSDSVFTIHTPVAAATSGSTPTWFAKWRAALRRRQDSARGPAASQSSGSWRLARGVDGNPAQLEMTALSLRLSNSGQRRQQAPWPSPPNGRGRASATSRSSLSRMGPHADMGRPADGELFLRYLDTQLDSLTARDGHRALLGADGQIPDAELWRLTSARSSS